MSQYEVVSFNNFEELLNYTIEKKDSGYMWFRGMSDSNYKLNSSIYRTSNEHSEVLDKERSLYFYFKTLGNDFFKNKEYMPWDQLFLMQHYGLPTRLLDWTTNFSVALYFCLEKQLKQLSQGYIPCIWFLNPQKLNQNTSIAELYSREESENLNIGLISIDHLPKKVKNYCAYFEDNDLSIRTFSLFPNRNSERIIKQSGVFTVQGTTNIPMEKEVNNNALIKVQIGTDLINKCISFLEINQVNRYTLFGGMDGLSNYIKDELMKINMINI